MITFEKLKKIHSQVLSMLTHLKEVACEHHQDEQPLSPLLTWDEGVRALSTGSHQRAGDGRAGDHLPSGRLFL